MRSHTLDLLFQNHPGIIAAYLIECGGDEFALIETGPASTHDTLIAAIRSHDVEPSQVRHVFVTHIHLDHSGDAGWWAQNGATVYCHPNAVKHLIDPSRLIDSARMVYGTAMDALWGQILPAPAPNVRILQDNESVNVGAIEIAAWDTPGHARHHHAYVIGSTCFTGDVAGVRLRNSGYISVAAAPPQFDPDEYVRSVDRLLAAKFKQLCLTHFGPVDDATDHLRRYRENIQAVASFARSSFASGESEELFRQRFQKAQHDMATASGIRESLWSAYELANSTAMCADGLRLYWKKRGTR